MFQPSAHSNPAIPFQGIRKPQKPLKVPEGLQRLVPGKKEGEEMPVWQKAALGAGAVLLAGGLVWFLTRK